MSDKIIPAHQWTDENGEVLVLRFIGHDGRSYQGFQNPTKLGESVTAPDWNPEPVCGGGIHGWPWGLGMGEGKDPEWAALWQVYAVAPSEIVGNLEGGQKLKFRTGWLVFQGEWWKATDFVLSGQMKWVHHASSGAASATGLRGAASATGLRGAASATGECSSAAVTGLDGKARGGIGGCIALAFVNPKTKKSEMRCAMTGKGRGWLKPNVWYRLNPKGQFAQVKP